ncbi:hypothetical protein GCM10011504_47340 [Siccirubricoccus deserti]|uniref:Calcium-binding protein n=1 Tax=Siccirubricoccus deserti TaxID=2013562 RepID=A0A9X0UF04_9PROT|nr:calcium-binding protein [Siccirubricoccus deserti]MBC4018237.1 hypothetical protein [Siccirubricoccus deserti]GGC63651.1 hypothetical protein GCM10011504_47340 [Siccirubricoccus deserti]
MTIKGGAGNDAADGSDLADLLSGGNGDDVLYGGGTQGNVFGTGSPGGVEPLIGGACDETLHGTEDAAGLLGGAGYDVLFGEAGADTFVSERGTGLDVIGAFTSGEDRLRLVGLGVTALAEVQAGFAVIGTDGTIAPAWGTASSRGMSPPWRPAISSSPDRRLPRLAPAHPLRHDCPAPCRQTSPTS